MTTIVKHGPGSSHSFEDRRSLEKTSEQQVDYTNPDALPEPDPQALKYAIMKLDFIFLPAVTMVYFLSFLDRSNIGNAKPAGLMDDLKLTNHQYSIALTVTYVPYIVAELPLTLLIRKVGPNILLPVLMVCWGLVTTFQGFVHNYAGLLVARFFLGAAEGAILPCCMTYLSTFYRRQDLAKRTAFLFCATSLAGAFSGLLAAAIVQMEGLGGKRGWAWIFILEGAFTVVYGGVSYFLLPRDPSSVFYLRSDQTQALLAALDRDRPPAENHEKIELSSILGAMKAPHVWLVGAGLFSSGTALFSMAYFSPTIVQGLGHKGTAIQLYSVPPYAVSAVLSLIICYWSDHTRHRGGFIIFSAILSLIGYALYLSFTDHRIRYCSLFFQVMGAYVGAPLLSTWMPNNLAPFYRRVTGIVWGFIVTNCGGILSTWLFPTTEGPDYRKATSILLGLSCAMMVLSVLNMAYLGAINKKRQRRGGFDLANGAMDDAATLGDRSVHYKYIL